MKKDHNGLQLEGCCGEQREVDQQTAVMGKGSEEGRFGKNLCTGKGCSKAQAKL